MDISTTTNYAVTDAILSVEHLTMRFGGLVAIGDVSFQAQRGDITALIGPNGAGKTTVFNCITGFYKPTEGMLTLALRDGQKFLLERLPGHEINARAHVARTFQNIRLFSGMTVLENLLVAQHNKLMKSSGYTVLGLLGSPVYKRAKDESMELARHWLEKADLTRRADEPAGSLPYGDQRRLEIARAMCTGPELLCLDEPAAGLNPRESLALNTLLMDIKNSTATSILLIEHDMSVVMQISDHVVVLEYGRKISDGNPTFVKSDPRVIAAYLGVEDEEVENVLVEVGDEDVIETLDAEPDREHGPGETSSMMAGPITDTVGHSDPSGEVVRVAPGASKAEIVDRRKAAAEAAAAASKTVRTEPPKAKPAPKPVTPKAAAPTRSAAAKPTVASSRPPSAKPAAPTKPASNSKSATSSPVYGLARTVKPAAKPAAPVASAGKAAARPATTKAAPAKPANGKAAPARPAAPAKRVAAAKPTAKPADVKSSAAAKPAPSKPAAPAIRPRKPIRTSNWLAAPRGNRPDDLLVIKGIGPVNKLKLNEHGIFHFDQIAAWTKADIATAEAYLEFDGRIEREGWIGQAKKLAAAADKQASAKRGGK
jgi:ABC-type branched-subunit amino acid transport system ATPase component/predicted flap endonuclease-1-like 5' DNA nuclease